MTLSVSELLERSFTSVRTELSCRPDEWRAEYFVSDDSSDESHSSAVDGLHGGRVVGPSANIRLGPNVIPCWVLRAIIMYSRFGTAGRMAAEPCRPKRAMKRMMQNSDIGILQLADFKCDGPSERAFEDVEFRVFENDRAPWWIPCRVRPRAVCQHPQRREPNSDIGPHRPGCRMGQTENDHERRVANPSRSRIAGLADSLASQHHGSDAFQSPGARQSTTSRSIASQLGRMR